MPTESLPTLDATGKIFDRFIPSTIARTVNVLAAALRGASNGVAPLDASGFLPVANVAPGSVRHYFYDGVAWPGARPTTRTDVLLLIFAPAGTAAPSWKLPTDSYETWGS